MARLRIEDRGFKFSCPVRRCLMVEQEGYQKCRCSFAGTRNSLVCRPTLVLGNEYPSQGLPQMMGRLQENIMNSHTRLSSIAAAALLMLGTTCAFAQADTSPKPTAPSNGNLTFDTTPSDHARLREIFGKDHSVRKISHVSFSLAPGSVVPGSVHLAPLPQTIVNIEPTWQGNEYFKVGRNEVVIVDPHSKKIYGVLSL